MDIGVVLQTTPPAARVIDLAKRADNVALQPADRRNKNTGLIQ